MLMRILVVAARGDERDGPGARSSPGSRDESAQVSAPLCLITLLVPCQHRTLFLPLSLLCGRPARLPGAAGPRGEARRGEALLGPGPSQRGHSTRPGSGPRRITGPGKVLCVNAPLSYGAAGDAAGTSCEASSPAPQECRAARGGRAPRRRVAAPSAQQQRAHCGG